MGYIRGIRSNSYNIADSVKKLRGDVVKKAMDMYLAGWCEQCKIPYAECAIKGICKAYENDEDDEEVCDDEESV